MRLTLALMLACGAPALAAADWRYCYGLDRASKRFHVSPPFSSDEPLPDVEDAFRAALDRRRVARPEVGCPKGRDAADVEAMTQAAAAYNRQNGNTAVPFDWAPDGRP